MSDDADKSASDLYGEWYRLDSTGTGNPSPAVYVNGFSIYEHENANFGYIHPLGIEGHTGRLALLDGFEYVPEIVQEFKQQMVIRAFIIPGFVRDTVSYRLESDKLILDGAIFDGTYHRSDMDNVVISPSNTEVSVVIDGEKLENAEVARKPPSAYISKQSSSRIKLVATVNNDLDETIYIDINNFQGPGTYIIGKEAGELIGSAGDVASTYTTMLDSAGTITIQSFNEESNRSTGSFEFTAHGYRESGVLQSPKTVTNGKFNLPVYE